MKRMLVAGSALVIAVSGCSSGASDSDSPAAASATKPPPGPVTEPPAESVTVRGGKKLKPSRRLSRPVVYDDKVKVSITGVKQVKSPDEGVGEVAGKPLTIFELRFDNGSAKPLNLNAVLVTVETGKRRREVPPTSYGQLNDFHGTLRPGENRTASYVFDLPKKGRKHVRLKVKFDKEHKPAIFRGALRRPR